MPFLDTERLHWRDEIPPLGEIMQFGGWPGCEYLYCTPGNEYRARNEGMETTRDGRTLILPFNRAYPPMFKVETNTGEAVFKVLEFGKPAEGISAGTTIQPLRVDRAIFETTGIDPITCIYEGGTPDAESKQAAGAADGGVREPEEPSQGADEVPAARGGAGVPRGGSGQGAKAQAR